MVRPALGESAEASEAAGSAATSEPAPDDAEKGSPEGIEEITVTARQRAESIQDTPISITAFSETGLDARGIRDLTELTAFTPNLRFTSSAAQSANAQIYIRGIGQNEGTINSEPRVGLYLDGVYQARPLGSVLSVFDLDRVEVLRGPQGTLYGKNAIGGAINVISNKPGPNFEAKAEVEAGNLSYQAARAMLNFPVDALALDDKLFLRGNFVWEKRDGYLYDIVLLQRFASHYLLGGSAEVRLLPSEGLDLQVNYSQTSQPQNSKRGECELIAKRQGSPFMKAIESPEGRIALSGDPANPASFSDYCRASRELTISTNMPNREEIDTKKLHGFVTYDSPEIGVLGSIKVTSISAYQSLIQNFNFDWDNTKGTHIHSIIEDLGHSQASQELRLQGVAWRDRIEWTLGGFYLGERGWGPPTNTDLLAPDFKLPSQLYAPLLVGIEERSDFQHETAAGYLTVEVEPIDRIHLNGGFRFGWEEKALHKARTFEICAHALADGFCYPLSTTPSPETGLPEYNIFGELIVPYQTDAGNSNSWRAPTGSFTVTYDITDDVNAYAGYQRGFSSGGFNYIGDDENSTPNAYEPETLDGVEIGVKTRWLDNHLTVNANYFWNYYDDMQVRIKEADNTGTSGQYFGVNDVIRNAGKATLQGGELEIVGMPTHELVLNANLGLVFPQYQDFTVLDADATRLETEIRNCGTPGCTLPDNFTIYPVRADYTNNAFPNTPKINFNIGAMYTWQVTPEIELTPWIDYSWQSQIYFDIANTEELTQDPVGILNGSVTLDLLSSRTQIKFWIKNALDETYRTSGYELGSYAVRFYGMPRTVGVSFTQRFGGT